MSTTWDDIDWTPNDSDLPSWLFQEDGSLTASNNGSKCDLSWTDENGNKCTVTLPGALPGTASGTNVTIDCGADGTVEVASMSLSADTAASELSGSLEGEACAADPGTITAQADIDIPPSAGTKMA
jgi:hypothetical protein